MAKTGSEDTNARHNGEARHRRGEEAEVRIPVVEESVEARKVLHQDRVRVQKRVIEEPVHLEEELLRQDVDVRRVPVEREIEEIPQVRRDGDRLIVPVVEERLVVKKVLVLKEELHLTTRTSHEREERDVVVRREQVDVERTERVDRKTDGHERSD